MTSVLMYGVTMTLIGMLIVFAVLFLLVGMVWVMSIFCSGIEQRKKEQQQLNK